MNWFDQLHVVSKRPFFAHRNGGFWGLPVVESLGKTLEGVL